MAPVCKPICLPDISTIPASPRVDSRREHRCRSLALIGEFVPCLRHETISARVLTELNRINDIKTKRFAGTGCLNGEGLLPWMVYSLESIHSGDCWLHNVSCMCRLYWLTRKNNNSKNGDWNRRKSTRTSIVRQDQTDMHLKLLSSCHIPSIPAFHSLNRHLDPVGA